VGVVARTGKGGDRKSVSGGRSFEHVVNNRNTIEHALLVWLVFKTLPETGGVYVS